MRGRPVRRRRNTSPTSGAITATAIRLRNPASSSPGTKSGPLSPAIGSAWSRSASKTVTPTNVGHIQAPRRRQRSRDHHTESTTAKGTCEQAREVRRVGEGTPWEWAGNLGGGSARKPRAQADWDRTETPLPARKETRDGNRDGSVRRGRAPDPRRPGRPSPVHAADARH